MNNDNKIKQVIKQTFYKKTDENKKRDESKQRKNIESLIVTQFV